MMQLCVGAETHDADEHQTRSLKKMRNIADGILLFASDTQTLNGMKISRTKQS